MNVKWTIYVEGRDWAKSFETADLPGLSVSYTDNAWRGEKKDSHSEYSSGMRIDYIGWAEDWPMLKAYIADLCTQNDQLTALVCKEYVKAESVHVDGTVAAAFDPPKSLKLSPRPQPHGDPLRESLKPKENE